MTTTAEPFTITKPGVYHGIPDAVYHADPVPGGSLSSTGARRLLDSPARFKWEQQHRTYSAAFDLGHAVHAKVLGVGAPVVTYPDEHLTPSGRASTRAKTVAWEAEQHAAGLTIVPAADLDRIDRMAEAVLAHPAARRLLEQPGHPEASVFATDPDTGVNVRARFDYLAATPTDLKTTAGSASALGFGRDSAKYGYPIQEAHYLDALRWATGDDDTPPMAWVVVEKNPPHLVAVHQFDEIVRAIARDLAAKARAIYAECKATDTWPGYPADVLTPQLPTWWIYQADEPEIEIA